MRLYKKGGIDNKYILTYTNSFFATGVAVYFSNKVTGMSGKWELESEDISKLKNLVNKYLDYLLKGQIFSRLKIGIDYFNSSFSKTSLGEKLIDLLISL